MTEISALRRLLLLSECGFSLDGAQALVERRVSLPHLPDVTMLRAHLRARIKLCQFKKRSTARCLYRLTWKTRIWIILSVLFYGTSGLIDFFVGELLRNLNLTLPLLAKLALNPSWYPLPFLGLALVRFRTREPEEESTCHALWHQLCLVGTEKWKKIPLAYRWNSGTETLLASALVNGNLRASTEKLARCLEWNLHWKHKARQWATFYILLLGALLFLFFSGIGMLSPFFALGG